MSNLYSEPSNIFFMFSLPDSAFFEWMNGLRLLWSTFASQAYEFFNFISYDCETNTAKRLLTKYRLHQ